MSGANDDSLRLTTCSGPWRRGSTTSIGGYNMLGAVAARLDDQDSSVRKAADDVLLCEHTAPFSTGHSSHLSIRLYMNKVSRNNEVGILKRRAPVSTCQTALRNFLSIFNRMTSGNGLMERGQQAVHLPAVGRARPSSRPTRWMTIVTAGGRGAVALPHTAAIICTRTHGLWPELETCSETTVLNSGRVYQDALGVAALI